MEFVQRGFPSHSSLPASRFFSVLFLACGEGEGSAILAVRGIFIDPDDAGRMFPSPG